MFKIISNILIFCICSTWVKAQEKTIDSLLNAYRKENIHDSLRTVKITSYFIEHSLKDYYQSKTCLEWLAQSKTKFTSESDKAAIFYALGVVYYYKSDYLNTIKYTQMAVQMAEKFDDYNNKKRILESGYGNLGLSYLVLNDYVGGYETILRALPYALEGNQKRAIYVYNLLAYAQKNLKNYKRAEELALTGLSYRTKCTDEPRYIIATIATLQSIKEKTKNFTYDKLAEKIIDSLFVKNRESINDEGIEEYYAIKGDIMRSTKNYKKAIEYFNLTIKYANSSGFAPSIAEGHFELARTQVLLGLHKDAEKNFEIAQKFADQNDPLYYLELLEEMAKYYLNQKNFAKSSFYFNKLNTKREAYLEQVNNNLLQVNDTKYQLSEKEKKIQLLNEKQKQEEELSQKRKNWIISLSILSLLLGISLYAFYRNVTYKRKITEQELLTLKQTQQLTATESIIKGQEEERSRLARDLHDGLGGLLSGIKLTLNNMTGNVILSEQNANVFTRALGQLDNAISEMRRVAHSMMPESLLKFGLVDAVNDFCEGISHSGKLKVQFLAIGTENMKLEQSEEITIYRIIQELLNNTLKHADATEAQVQIAKTDELLSITVEDNGKGFDSSQLNKNKGIGISNIENRVAYLNGKLEVRSELGKGTSTNIEIIQKS